MTKSSVLSVKDLQTILPFGKSKLYALVKSGALPVIKVGRNYVTTREAVEQWIQDHMGETIEL